MWFVLLVLVLVVVVVLVVVPITLEKAYDWITLATHYLSHYHI